MQKTAYNGYTNYETWAVKLWLDNEEPTYRYWRERTREVYRRSTPGGLITSFTRDDNARMALAEALKDEHGEALPKLQGFASDLLNAAFGEVDWHDIARSLLDSHHEDEPTFSIGDDGTLDTVVVCDSCGEELRYNFSEHHPDCVEEAPDAIRECECYAEFREYVLEDAASEHECSRE